MGEGAVEGAEQGGADEEDEGSVGEGAEGVVPERGDEVEAGVVLERFRGFTLVKVQPRTGRTHQIRVHLLYAGCPVLADKLYGGRSQVKLSDLTQEVPAGGDEVLIARQALHAFRLRFRHPRTEQWIEAEAPFPSDMRRTLESLRKHRPAR